VPEVMTFQTKSLGDGVYRLSPFTSGAYEIFAQIRGAAPQIDIQTGRMSVNIATDDGRRRNAGRPAKWDHDGPYHRR